MKSSYLPHYSLKHYLLMLVYLRVWDAENVLMSTDSITPTSASAMMELTAALKTPGRTSRPTGTTLWWSRLLMFQLAPDGSHATTRKSLKKQLWHRQGSSSCGSDDMTLTSQRPCKCWQLPTAQHLPIPEILLRLKH